MISSVFQVTFMIFSNVELVKQFSSMKVLKLLIAKIVILDVLCAR